MPELTSDARPGPALTTLLCDTRIERLEDANESMLVDSPAAAFALVGPVDQVAVTTLTITALAGCNLVLQTRRAAFEPGHDVLGGGLHERRVDLAATPDTGDSIAIEDQLETATSAWCGHGRHDVGRGTPRPRSLV